ncbi:unnamed protein product [Soboliphyme baturini]|uniref:RING-type domain-containing protein n=1 Tax=Soboliphyme baturini TaxID=241478 RepID=A0A183IYZ0_9BILA|nr:unnamed protein product [Soboliphyme baturini]
MTETDETHSVEEGEASSSSTSSSASVGGSDRCPICLNVFRDEVVGTPETCSHTFCVECLYEWAQQTATCPVDRSNFDNILVKSITTSHLIRKIVVEKVTKVDSSDELNEDDLTFCEVCNRSDREDQLLLCDGCDAGRRTSRGIPRTRAAERLRSRIARRRERGVLTPSENLSPAERSKPRSVQSKLVATLGLRKADRYLFPQYHASLLSKGSASGSSSRSSMRLAFKGFLPFEGIEEPEGPRLPSRSEPRISNKAEAFNKPIRKAKNSNQAASAPAENDLLGKILEKQAVLGISSRDLTIGKDGSINVKDETQRKHSRHDELKKRDDRAPSSSAYDHTWRDRKKEMSRGGGDLRTVKGESASGVAERRCSHVASCSKSVQTPPAQPKSSLPFNSVDGESMDHSESEPLRSEAMYPRTDKKLLPPLPLHLIPFPTTRLLSGNCLCKFFLFQKFTFSLILKYSYEISVSQ